MYIVGDQRCQVRVEEPAVLVMALYLRGIAGLTPPLPYQLPPLDPPITTWPAWARRAPMGWTPPLPARTRLVDPTVADLEWARWWAHLLSIDHEAEAHQLRPPHFRELQPVPAIQLLMRRHYDDAVRWAEAITDDPRVKSQHAAPRHGMTELIGQLESDPVRIPRAFDLRLTVLPVQTKHAWPLADDHILISRRLIADTDNAMDWLRPRITALAWREGHITLSQ